MMNEEYLAVVLERIAHAEQQTRVAIRAFEHIHHSGMDSRVAKRALVAQMHIVQLLYLHRDQLIATLTQVPSLTI